MQHNHVSENILNFSRAMQQNYVGEKNPNFIHVQCNMIILPTMSVIRPIWGSSETHEKFFWDSWFDFWILETHENFLGKNRKETHPWCRGTNQSVWAKYFSMLLKSEFFGHFVWVPPTSLVNAPRGYPNWGPPRGFTILELVNPPNGFTQWFYEHPKTLHKCEPFWGVHNLWTLPDTSHFHSQKLFYKE